MTAVQCHDRSCISPTRQPEKYFSHLSRSDAHTLFLSSFTPSLPLSEGWAGAALDRTPQLIPLRPGDRTQAQGCQVGVERP